VEIREDEIDVSLLRIGGLELSTGLSATLWFGVPSRTR